MTLRQSTVHRGCSLSWSAEGAGPPVLLIHGTGVGAHAWEPQVEALAPTFACARFDNRGFGLSQPAAEALSLDLLAEDAAAVLDAAGWESAHVVGHSLGGLIALYLAHHARRRVRSLSLLNTFAAGAVPTRLTPTMVWLGLRTMIGPLPARRRAFLEMILAPSEREQRPESEWVARLSDLFERDLGQQSPIAFPQIRAMGRADATPFLGDLGSLPTLVVASQHDPLAPPWAGRALAQGIAGARYVELAGSSHAAPIARAAEVNALLCEHLLGAERPSAS